MKTARFYHEIAKAKIKEAINLSEVMDSISHNGQKGRARELFVSNILKPYLSPNMGICTGVVINREGQQSGQIDVIVYDQRILPPLMLADGEGYIPCESVLATIEVKSRLKLEELIKGIKSGISVKELGLGSLISKTETPNVTPSFIFAFNSDLNRKSEKDRLLESIDKVNNERKDNGESPYYLPIGGLCIPNKVMILHTYNGWDEILADNENIETLRFITSVVSTCSEIASQRDQSFLEHYIL